LRGLEGGACGEVTLYYKQQEVYKPVRLCAIRKAEEASDQRSAAKGVERLKVMNRMKRHGKPPSEAQVANNRYVIVIMSLLETDAELILHLYRFRWQIELVFKRLKSLFEYNQIPSKVDISAKAQVYGKLLLAAFGET
jgi:IS4 transposase